MASFCSRGLRICSRQLLNSQARNFSKFPTKMRAYSWAATFAKTQRQDQQVTVSAVKVNQPDTVHVEFSDNMSCCFKNIWLRDNCQCPECIHPQTLQKIVDTVNLDLGTRPKNVGVNETGQVEVEWISSDGSSTHKSAYDIKWLYEYSKCFRDSANICRYIHPSVEYWNLNTFPTGKPPTIQYEDFMETDEGLKAFLEAMIKYGIALIKGTPTTEEGIIKTTERFSFVTPTMYGKSFNVKFIPTDPRLHLAYTGFALEQHTDLPYKEKSPGIQILHCINSSLVAGTHEAGGMSVFNDGYYAANWLKENHPEYFHILSTIPITAYVSMNSVARCTFRDVFRRPAFSCLKFYKLQLWHLKIVMF
ncbi:trimethyllysine dioxygenase, mitochondrial-like [Limulus polyphemus]|uniref:Trimethyllysine dioxygenase, mitochondrial-like n=1 Tax=Limulus polyphemus TaxID=6850 RepID=A0ABM1SET6_LIMPO|nr:trimethyllysine dioxygenase, mitochondrial-like [Limulus polyphemus]XP_022242142.1 trimethyllysine dioxygenase, mitochondrial-like [Limulus polyphemus]